MQPNAFASIQFIKMRLLLGLCPGLGSLWGSLQRSPEARFALFISPRFSENLRKKHVRNANSTQHLRYSQRISEILREIKSAKRVSGLIASLRRPFRGGREDGKETRRKRLAVNGWQKYGSRPTLIRS